MQQAKPAANHDQSSNGKRPPWFIRWLCLVAGVLIGFFTAVAIFLPEITERWKFIGTTLFSFLALIVIVAQAIIYQRQREVMTETLEQNKRLLKAVEDQRKAMHAQAAGIAAQGRIMHGQLTEMREQSGTARITAHAAELSATAAVESAHLMAQAQRPDIALDLAFGPLIPGQPITMQFQAFNAGRTTAYNFGMHISCDWKDADFDGVLDYGTPKPAASEPIRPGKTRYVHPQWLDYLLQPLEFIRLQNGSRWLLVYGVLWYEDGTGKRYEEPFCRRWDRGSPTDAVECPYSLRDKMQADPPSADGETQKE
jgi:hypothetical protein